jgi:hypothetical protein
VSDAEQRRDEAVTENLDKRKLDSEPLVKHPNLVVAPCEYGHGVFSTGDIPADTTIEECPFLRMKGAEFSGIVDDYVYHLDEEKDDDGKETWIYSFPLGWGCVYNHSDDPNTDYWIDTERNLIVFDTVKDISAGDQLFINYGKEWWEARDLTPDNGT